MKDHRKDAKYAEELLLETVSCSEPANRTRKNTGVQPMIKARMRDIDAEIPDVLPPASEVYLH